jgi:hypothetical protein
VAKEQELAAALDCGTAACGSGTSASQIEYPKKLGNLWDQIGLTNNKQTYQALIVSLFFLQSIL